MIVRKKSIKKVFYSKFIYSLFLILISINLFSQNRFEHITIKDGLANNSVKDIIQTKNGFLWFATLNGLSRYDGKEIRNYTYEPGNLNSLTGNRIFNMFEDDWGYIWLLTYEYHVIRFDPKTERFINTNKLLPPGIFQPGRKRVDILSTSSSIVWIASENGGILRLKQQKESDEFNIDYFEVGEDAPSDEETFLFKDSKNRVWIGTYKGLMMLENDSADFSTLTKLNNHIIDNNYHFTTYCEDKKGNLIFGTKYNGLFEYFDGSLNRWYVLPDSTLSIRGIQVGKSDDIAITTSGKGIFHVDNNLIVKNYQGNKWGIYYRIFCDKAGTFWILTPERGISMFNPETKVLKHFDLNSKMRESQGDPDKQQYLEDSKGNVWIGIYGGGLFRFDREEQRFINYSHQPNNTHSLSSNFVLSLFEDYSENLWIGTFKSGLDKLNLSESIFQYNELVKNPIYESQNEVRCFAEDGRQRLWIGTKHGNIYCCDKNNNILFRIPEDISNKDDYPLSNVYALLSDGNDLWVGTKGNCLIHVKDILDFEKVSNKRFAIDIYQNNSKDPSSLPNNNIFSMLQDQYGQIWIGTYHGGLSVIKNPNIDIKFTNYTSSVDDSTTLSDNRIRKIYKDRNNNIWIGTANGLNYLESRYLTSDIKRFKRFYKDPEKVEALSNSDIFDIHQDLNNIIWIATYGGGLNSMYFDSDSVNFSYYFRRDGLPSNIIFSILEDENYNLWLGTDNGLGKFSTISHTSEIVDDEDGSGHGMFSEGCKFKSRNWDLIFGTKNGYIRFNPDSINNKKKAYPLVFTEFRLFDEIIFPGVEGSPLNKPIDQTKEIKLKYDQNFIEIKFAVMDFDAPDKIQYSYILDNYEKKWNVRSSNASAVYKALPPGEYVFKLKATDSKGVQMDETRELSIIVRPPVWKTIWAFLIYTIMLGSTLIVVFKEVRTRSQIRYENILTEEKFKFFTNISHEFKTPLTLIDNSVDDLSKTIPSTTESNTTVSLIKRNIQNLNSLIEQLISFRRLQNGKLELRVKKIEIISYLYDIYLTFLPYSEKKELIFNFNTNVDTYEGYLDNRYIDIILNNLLSNAFKHTPSNKTVLFNVSVSSKDESLVIKVQDQGEGISQEYIDKIFERFVFVENYLYSSFKGSGIGLSLSKELINLHKGTIKLDSTINEGSTFTVEIPIGLKHYKESEIAPVDDNNAIQQPKPFYSYNNTPAEKPVSQPRITASGLKFKVLVVEDNQELREYMHDKLQKDFTVFIANNGEEGFELAKDVNPDIIISDFKMPKLDGVELTKLLKKDAETSHIPIILLTAKSSISSKIEGIDSGVDDYITKPFNMEYLVRRIQNIIIQRKQLKEIYAKDPGLKPEKLTVSNEDQKFLNKIIELTEANMKTPNFTIDDIIAEFGMSRSAFFRKMKTAAGHPPKEFVRIIKMKKAAEMLRESKATIAEVCYNVGFSDLDYFRKSFKNFFGETPSTYRKKHS